MEQQRHQPNGGEDRPEISPNDTDDLEEQAGTNYTESTEQLVAEIGNLIGVDLHGVADADLLGRLAKGVAEHGTAFAAYVQLVGTEDRDLLNKFEDFYVGSYDSPEAWARSVGEDLGWDTHLDQVVDPMLRPYLVIDYARFASDQRHAWDVLEGIDGKTHVFMR